MNTTTSLGFVLQEARTRHARRAGHARARRRRPPPRRRPSPRPRSPASPPFPARSSIPARPAAEMKLLKTTPDIALAGHADHDLRHRPSGRQGRRRSPGARRTSTGCSTRAPTASTTSAARPRSTPSQLAHSAQTDANGAFSVKLKAPEDFGGLHDIYAVVDGLQVAKGGFLIARSASISPKKGPIGTMITVTLQRASAPRCTRAAARSSTTTSTSAR